MYHCCSRNNKESCNFAFEEMRLNWIRFKRRFLVRNVLLASIPKFAFMKRRGFPKGEFFSGFFYATNFNAIKSLSPLRFCRERGGEILRILSLLHKQAKRCWRNEKQPIQMRIHQSGTCPQVKPVCQLLFLSWS